MPAFDFRHELQGEWATARGFLVEQFDRLYAYLGAIFSGVPSAVLATDAAGTPSLTTLLPMPLGFAQATILTPLTLAVSTNNYAPAGLAGAAVVRMSASGAIDLTGLQAGSANTLRLLVNAGSANTITLKHASASSQAANRWRCSGAADIALGPGSARWIWYDASFAVWQVV